MFISLPRFTDAAWGPAALSYTQSLKGLLAQSSFNALREAVLPDASSWAEAITSTLSQAWQSTSVAYHSYVAPVVTPVYGLIGSGLEYIGTMEAHARDHHAAVMADSFHKIAPFAHMLAQSKDDLGLVALLKTVSLFGKATLGLISDAEYDVHRNPAGKWFSKACIELAEGRDELQHMVGTFSPDVTKTYLTAMDSLVQSHLAALRYEHHEDVSQPRSYAQFTPQTETFHALFAHASKYIELAASSATEPARTLTPDELHAAFVEHVDGYEASFKIAEQGPAWYYAEQTLNGALNHCIDGAWNLGETLGLVDTTA